MTVAFAGSVTTLGQAEDVRARVTVARIDDWVLGAQPNARRIYGLGLNASAAAGAGVAARVRALTECGLVMPISVRVKRADGDVRHPFDFLIIRTSLPVPPGFPVLPAAPVVRPVTVTKLGSKRK